MTKNDLMDLLYELKDYMHDRADSEGDSESLSPNKEMVLMQEISDMLYYLGDASEGDLGRASVDAKYRPGTFSMNESKKKVKKIVKLKESDLVRMVRKVIKEAAPEPVLGGHIIFGNFLFDEGKSKPSMVAGKPYRNDDSPMIKQLVDWFQKTGTVDTLSKQYKNPNFKIPKFIELNVGTSHTGSGDTNASVAEGRIGYLKSLIKNAMDKMGVDSAMIEKFIVTNTDAEYVPSNLDKNFFDPKKVKANPEERFGYIKVNEIVTRGLDTKGIQRVQSGLKSASSDINNWVVDGVDEDTIVNQINNLQSFSDIQDLDDAISAAGQWSGLEDFLNDQLFDDPDEIKLVAKHLKELALVSGKQFDTVRLYSGANGSKISIGMGR